MSTSAIQAWVAIIGALLTAVLGLLRYFNYKSKRDRMTTVGASFSTTVESLMSDSEIERMAAAVLLRRFFDRGTEQGRGGAPYKRETVEVIAAVLRQVPSGLFQKVLADGLRYARNLVSADLQRCNLRDAYLGRKPGDKRCLNLSNADLFGADCTGASFREVIAKGSVFTEATLEGSVFIGAKLQQADFRRARLSGARFSGAYIEGARFEGAHDLPQEVAELLDDDLVGIPAAIVGEEGAGH
jgi:uncharacterized protein YjbI with pentapeptide repeats